MTIFKAICSWSRGGIRSFFTQFKLMKNLSQRKKIWLFLLCGLGSFLLANLFYSYPLASLKSTTLHDKNGQLISGIKIQSYESSSEIPENLKQAVMKIEDRRYYRNLGIDPIAILRAIRFNATTAGKRQWASTIPQQLVKITEQAYKRTRKQKIKEMLIAFNLSLHHSKGKLLTAYLNQVEFLNGIRGYKSACEVYFAKPCSAFFPSELSFLIATAQTGKNPLNQQSFPLIKQRAKVLCPIAFSAEDCESREELPPLSPKELKNQTSSFSHLSQYLQGQGEENQTSELDLQLHDRIQSTIQASESYRSKAGIGDCCILVLNAEGKLRSMNTCRPFEDEEQGQVNGCLSKRQTGSAIKPFLYLFAMDQLGLTWWSTIFDEPVSYYLDEEHVYSPKNFSLNYYGEVSLADALGNSLNIPAVKLVHEVGVEQFVSFLEDIRKKIWTPESTIAQESTTFNAKNLGLSVALGTYELSPLEFAQLWRVFLANELLPEHYAATKQSILSILSKNQHRLLSFGIDNYLDQPWWSVKSGTSRHFVDGRTCGVNPEKQTIVCVRAGNYDSSPMKESWSLTAGYLWNLVVEKV